MSERIYPTTTVEVLDGNLIDRVSVPETAVLVIERAEKGPVDQLYYVSDAKTAARVFGGNSPLIAAMYRVMQGGAKDVVLYRVGGRAASIDNLFGLSTSISTVETSSKADHNFSLYIGPEPNNPSVDCVIIYDEKKRIIYSNANDSKVDYNMLLIDGFTKTANTIYVGSHLNPVPFNKVVENLGKRTIKTGTEATVDIDQADFDKLKKESVVVKVNGVTLKAGDYEFGVNQVTVKDEKLPKDSGGVVVQPLSVEVAYVIPFTKDELEEKEITYTTGEDLLNTTWKKYYEALYTALETIPAIETVAVYGGEVFNVPNIVDGDEGEDRLEYIHVTQDENGDFSYEWSDKKIFYRKKDSLTNEMTADINEAELDGNGQPIIVKRYHETDFTHRLGMWALLNTTKGKYPNVVVGAMGPKAYTPKYLNLWVGRPPAYTQTGEILLNGTGLLGHRLMVGSKDFRGGYYGTTTGFPDGEAAYDSAGAIIDLGKYISVVTTQITTGNATVSGAATYAGMISQTTPGNSTTNKAIPNVVIATELKEAKLRDLQAMGYVVFQTRLGKGPTVVSGNLASRLTSDFRYVSTAITMTRLTSDIAEICDPFIGNGIDGAQFTALHTALVSRLQQRQKEGYFTSFLLHPVQTGPNSIHVEYHIQPKEELRQVTNTIQLSRNLTNT